MMIEGWVILLVVVLGQGADGQRQQQEAVLSVLVQSTTAFADRHMDVSDKDTVQPAATPLLLPPRPP